MKFFVKWLAAIKKSYFKIKLVDRCLIIFMLLLMAQSTYNLFTNEVDSQETNTIDIVVRTTSAAIFGYFLSANFIKRESQSSSGTISAGAPPSVLPPPPAGTAPESPAAANQIGFSAAPGGIQELSAGTARSNVPALVEESETSHQQVIIATLIGVFALMILIVARNFCQISPAMFGTISQMRDFVSGCVGFLLGSPGTTRTSGK